VGFVVAAVLAVAVADGTADRLLPGAGSNAQRLAGALVVGGRVVGGWALGMAFRLQFVRAVSVDRQARLLLGVPACLVATWPIAVTFLPAAIVGGLPGWVGTQALAGVAPFAGVVLGLVLSLGVTGAGRGVS
jgi:hypothetical protein